jgi:hypothetical protein
MAYIRYNISRINFLNIWETGVWVLNFDDMDDNEELYEELFLESEDLEESQSYRRNPAYKILAGILLLIFLFISLPHVHVLFDGSMDFLKKRALSVTTHLLQECWQINGMLRTNSIRQLSAGTHSKKHNLKDADELRRLAGFMNTKEMKRNA